MAKTPKCRAERRAVRRDSASLGGDRRVAQKLALGNRADMAELDDHPNRALGPRLLEEVGRHGTARLVGQGGRGHEEAQRDREARCDGAQTGAVG